MTQGESSLCYLDSLIKPNIIYGPQDPNLHYMAQKYKAQIILNNLYKLEDFSLIFYFLQRDFFMFVFGSEQLIKSPNRIRWAQSSGMILILPLTLCPFYSLINDVATYFIISSLLKGICLQILQCVADKSFIIVDLFTISSRIKRHPIKT